MTHGKRRDGMRKNGKIGTKGMMIILVWIAVGE